MRNPGLLLASQHHRGRDHQVHKRKSTPAQITTLNHSSLNLAAHSGNDLPKKLKRGTISLNQNHPRFHFQLLPGDFYKSRGCQGVHPLCDSLTYGARVLGANHSKSPPDRPSMRRGGPLCAGPSGLLGTPPNFLCVVQIYAGAPTDRIERLRKYPI
jgi:hypothetical protein